MNSSASVATASERSSGFTQRQIVSPSQARLRKAHDTWVIFLLVVPIFATFYPLESYLSLGQGEDLTGFVNLPVPVTSITLVALMLTAIFQAAAIIRRTGRFRHLWGVYVLVALCFASAAWSINPASSLNRALRLLPFVGLAMTLTQFYTQQKLLKLLTIAALIAAVASVFMSIFVPFYGLARIGRGYEDAWRGATVHKNVLGAVASLSVIIVLGAWWTRAVAARLAIPTLLVCTLVVARADSATAASALAASLASGVALTLMQKVPFRIRVLVFVLTMLSLLLLTAIAVQLVAVFLGATNRGITLTGRTDIWSAVWILIKQHPLRGYGYAFWVDDSNSRRMVWDIVGDTAAHSHNSYLDAWLQLGFVGLLTVLFLLGQGVFLAVKESMLRGSKDATMYFCIVIFLVVRSIAEVQFTDPILLGMFFLVWADLSLLMMNDSPWRARRPGGLRSGHYGASAMPIEKRRPEVLGGRP